MDEKDRECWIDNVKVLACILVVLGHFFQSMTKAGILPDSDFLNWFDQTIYYFHVPLFFICSGYLYQRNTHITGRSSWIRHVERKALTLGVPYITFSIATWILKTVFSGSVNGQVSGLTDTLLFHPASPYWYLYCLFFLFVIFLPFHGKTGLLLEIGIAVLLKACDIFWPSSVKLISYITANGIWFTAGMSLCFLKLCVKSGKKPAVIGGIVFAVFLTASVPVYACGIGFKGLSALMSIIACSGVVLFAVGSFAGKSQIGLFAFASKYTMPVFLMHTLCAAPVRVFLTKVEVRSGWIHVAVGLVASFAGPVILAIIMKKSRWLEFFIYPSKVLKI